jgi:AbrB family looped-hinge helix DNA binding protein
MSEKIIIGRRGVMTLPSKIRKRYDLNQNDELIVEETPQGILLRPSISIPIEYYTEERIAEFEEDDAAIGRALDNLKQKNRKNR